VEQGHKEAQKAQKDDEKTFVSFVLFDGVLSALAHIATHCQILYTFRVEYPFPPVGIVGAADGKNRRAFFFLKISPLCFAGTTA